GVGRPPGSSTRHHLTRRRGRSPLTDSQKKRRRPRGRDVRGCGRGWDRVYLRPGDSGGGRTTAGGIRRIRDSRPGALSSSGVCRGRPSQPELPMLAPRTVLPAVALLAVAAPALAQPPRTGPKPGPDYTRTEDVVYGRRDGLALTLDVFTPETPNGAGVVVFVSAEYRSGRGLLDRFGPAIVPRVGRGYTVFAVVHGSQPRYTVPDIVEDAHRAVRFVRHSARRYGVDPERLGAGGGSAGGHLALMVGCAGRPGDPGAKDPV